MIRIVITTILIVTTLSCAKNPFSSRESEQPSSEAGTFIPPTSPEIVLENLQLSYSELVIGNFIQTLDSNFSFSFDYVEGVITDSTWGFAEEINLTENMFSELRLNQESRSISIELAPRIDYDDILLDTAATLIRSYLLIIADSSGAELERYEGVSQFDLVENSFNFWTLLSWEDLHLDTETKSWADLKTRYR